jgi:hypothetical protein
MKDIAIRPSARRFREQVHRFRWLHQGIGVLGGLTFFAGSIFFLYHGVWETAGIWLFIIGSAGMFIGNVGSVIVNYRIDKSGNHESPPERERTEPIG